MFQRRLPALAESVILTPLIKKLRCDPLPLPICRPMLFQIRNTLANLPMANQIAGQKNALQSNAKLPKFIAAIRVLARRAHTKRTMAGYDFVIGHSCFVIPTIRVIRGSSRRRPVPIRVHSWLNGTSLTPSYEGRIRNCGEKKNDRLFMIGMLCGVMITAAVTYVFAIPANSDYWRMEIYKRGGAAWTVDRTGHVGWKWMIEPIPDTPIKKRIIAPPSAVKVKSELL